MFDPPATIPSSRPNFNTLLRVAAVKGGRRPSRSDLPLTVASAAAVLLVRGRPEASSGLYCRARLFLQFSVDSYDDTEGGSPSGASIAPQTCIRSIREDRNHDAVMRIGGEAPRRRAHSKPRLKDHVQGRVAATSVRPRRARLALTRFTMRVHSLTRLSRSRLGASSSSSVGIAAILQCFGSPRSQPRKARLSSSVSRRSVFARRCSRETGTLDGWIT
jgi:hypothetical protein